MQPIIKWTGSKRLLSNKIISYFPTFFNYYYEPFIGGGSLLYLVNKENRSNFSVAGDICKSLIDLWKVIKFKPEDLADFYEQEWLKLKANKEYYYEVRNRFNQFNNPYDFLFLSRTCTNGLIRFNQKGEFNNSLHHNRDGILPNTLRKIIFDWHENIKLTFFYNQDYQKILDTVKKDDFVYLDPPYFNTKGQYLQNTINYNELLNFLNVLNEKSIKWILSYDGNNDNKNYKEIPKDLYKRKELLPSQSSFRKLRNDNSKVYESIYINY